MSSENAILTLMTKFLKLFFIFTALLGVVAFAGVVYFISLLQPVSSTPASSVRFTIPKGQATSIIGQRLQEEGLIKNALVFRLVVKQQGLANKIQAGSFKISPDMTTSEIAQALTKGTEDVWVTIPEGWRVEQIAEMLENQELEDFDKQEFLELAQSDEGYLFPDTYLVPRMMSTQAIYNLLINTFDTKVTEGLADELAETDRSLEDIIIMASVIEREGKGYEQLRHVAGILYHRLDIGMALQVDATLQYIKGYNATQDTWWATPLAADKTIESPYNTYLNPGLPPKPICNPGLDAIRATINYVETDNLFYIHDSSGKMHYARTLEEHNANVEQYLR